MQKKYLMLFIISVIVISTHVCISKHRDIEKKDTQSRNAVNTERDKPKKQKRTVTIKNNISEEEVSYKHWTGKYKPTTFVISVNGQHIEPGQEKEVAINSDEELKVRYDYSFANGYKTGAKEVAFDINETTKKADISFSWDDEWRIQIENGIPKSVEEASFAY
jgi:hypothetical protein